MEYILPTLILISPTSFKTKEKIYFMNFRRDCLSMGSTKVPAFLWSPPRSNAHSRLSYLYYFINRYLLKYPEECAYRKNTKAIIDYRQSIIEATDKISEVESMICCGRVEQLIQQAENELALCKKLLPYTPWEPLTSVPPEDQWKWPIVKN